MAINIKNNDQVITPEEFQVLIQNKNAGCVFVPNPWDWGDILHPEKDHGFLGAFKAISCELPFEQQKDYIEKMDVWAWMQVFEHQREDFSLDFLLPRSTVLFSTYAAPQIQKDVLSAILKEKSFDSFSFYYPIAEYIEHLGKIDQGREILKQVGNDFSSKHWATLICHPSLFVKCQGTKTTWYDPNSIQKMCEICGGYEKFSSQDWQRVAKSYADYLGLDQIKKYFIQHQVWNNISPDTLVAWFENTNGEHQYADRIIAEWADHHTVDGKIDRHKNLSSLYLSILNQDIDSFKDVKAVIIGKLARTPSFNSDEYRLSKDQWRTLEPLTKKQWMELVLKDPKMLPLALDTEFGQNFPPLSLKTFWTRLKQTFQDIFRKPHMSDLRRELIQKYPEFTKQIKRRLIPGHKLYGWDSILLYEINPWHFTAKEFQEASKRLEAKKTSSDLMVSKSNSIDPDQIINQMKEIRRVESINLPTTDMAKGRSMSHSHHQ